MDMTIRSLMHTVYAMSQANGKLKDPILASERIRMISLICNGLKDYFPVMSPMNRDTWIEAQEELGNSKIAEEYRYLSYHINEIMNFWYIVYKIMEQSESELQKLNKITLVGSGKLTDKLYRFFCNIRNITLTCTDCADQYYHTYHYENWDAFFRNEDKKILDKLKHLAPHNIIIYMRKNIVFPIELPIETEMIQLSKYCYDTLYSNNALCLLRNYYQTWLPVIRKEKNASELPINYAEDIGNDILKIMEDVISTSIFFHIWEKSPNILEKIFPINIDTDKTEKLITAQKTYYKQLKRLKKLTNIWHMAITQKSINKAEIRRIWESNEIQITDSDLQSFYPDPSDSKLYLSVFRKINKKIEKFNSENPILREIAVAEGTEEYEQPDDDDDIIGDDEDDGFDNYLKLDLPF